MPAKINPREIIKYFYPHDTGLRRLLIRHSEFVCEKALLIARKNPGKNLDLELIACGAMLHDIGIGKCKAQSIYCLGIEPYIRHGILGAEMLRNYGKEKGVDMEPYARICERHTGCGLAAEEIRAQGLPLPQEDFLPETPEEKIICLADKFFSKSGSMKEKRLRKIVRGMEKFGQPQVQRFLRMAEEFHIAKVRRVTTPLMEACGWILVDILLAGLTTSMCSVGIFFFWLKAAFLLFFLIRSIIFDQLANLQRRDILIYELIYLLIFPVELFVHF